MSIAEDPTLLVQNPCPVMVNMRGSEEEAATIENVSAGVEEAVEVAVDAVEVAEEVASEREVEVATVEMATAVEVVTTGDFGAMMEVTALGFVEEGSAWSVEVGKSSKNGSRDNSIAGGVAGAGAGAGGGEEGIDPVESLRDNGAGDDGDEVAGFSATGGLTGTSAGAPTVKGVSNFCTIT